MPDDWKPPDHFGLTSQWPTNSDNSLGSPAVVEASAAVCSGSLASGSERQRLEKCQDLPPPQLTAYDHLTGRIDAMHLKDRLGDIETNRRNRLHR
jgi:hypothetical protein